jgi:AraC-like DNA-binding protein
VQFRDVLPEILPLHPHFQNLLNRRVRIPFDNMAPLTELLARMCRELQERRPGSDDVVHACFRILLIECCRRALEVGILPGLQRERRALPWLERVRRRLDQSFRETHTLASLARFARVSPAHLCRAFKHYSGKNLFDYLLERRLQAAMLALRGTDEKILSIALESGFNDVAYFNRRFKQIVGRTPGEYRKAVQ